MSKYVLLAIITQLVASTVPSASKLVLNNFPVEPYIALRWTISALIFGLLLFIRKEKCNWSLRLIAKISALGLGGYVLASLGTLYAVKIGGVSFFGLLTLLSPLIVVALSPLVLNERIHRNTWFALAMAIVGIIIMVNGKFVVSSLFSAIAATLLVLMAYTFDTLTLLYSKPFRSQVSLIQYLFVAQSAAAIVMWVASLMMYSPVEMLPSQSEVWAAILYVAVVSCVGIFFVWYWLLKHLQGQQLGVLQYFHGIAAAGLGALLFDEAITLQMLVGSLVLFASILIVSISKKATHRIDIQ
jgi:drug/metabolite transporter (DMT)-like permease